MLCESRSISLVGCAHKFLLKISANHFKGVFVGSRQIHNGVMIANELIDSRKESSKVGIISIIQKKKRR